jgi:hypothetical protein
MLPGCCCSAMQSKVQHLLVEEAADAVQLLLQRTARQSRKSKLRFPTLASSHDTELAVSTNCLQQHAPHCSASTLQRHHSAPCGATTLQRHHPAAPPRLQPLRCGVQHGVGGGVVGMALGAQLPKTEENSAAPRSGGAAAVSGTNAARMLRAD